MEDFKLIVKNITTVLVKGAIDRLLLFHFDKMLDETITLFLEEKKEIDSLAIFQKRDLYNKIWAGVLQNLYDEYAPWIKYEFKWEIEITPYTLMLCKLSPLTFDENELIIKDLSIIKFNREQFDEKFNDVIADSRLDKFFSLISDDIYPYGKLEKYNLLIRLMNFPPLNELANFYSIIYHKYKKGLENLFPAFCGVKTFTIPDFSIAYPLHYSIVPFSHKIIHEKGIDFFINHVSLSEHKQELESIKQKSIENDNKITGQVICKGCGGVHDATVPIEAIQYKLILENLPLANSIGLIFHNDFIDDFKNTLADNYFGFLDNLNNVEKPDCIILVEGDSEEFALPILAFRKRFILAFHNIFVHNSGSKEKLEADFFSFKKKHPLTKIICVLDSDSVKEKDAIERVIKNRKNQYHLFYITKGTFEDIFPIDVSISILNELYSEGDPILESDFVTEKDFLSNIKKVLFQKKKASFDKVKFAKKISLKIDATKIPTIIDDIIEVASNFTKKDSIFRN